MKHSESWTTPLKTKHSLEDKSSEFHKAGVSINAIVDETFHSVDKRLHTNRTLLMYKRRGLVVSVIVRAGL